jgi:hypothetical protein
MMRVNGFLATTPRFARHPRPGALAARDVPATDSEYADHYTTTNSSGVETVVPVAGKQVTDTPEILFKSQIAYDNGAFFFRADINHTVELYYSTIDSNGFVNSDPNGTTQTLLLGAPRQFFLSLKARF